MTLEDRVLLFSSRDLVDAFPEGDEVDAEFVALFKGSSLKSLSYQALYILWRAFSEVQCATWMCADDEETREGGNVTRFIRWVETGDDEEAWT